MTRLGNALLSMAFLGLASCTCSKKEAMKPAEERPAAVAAIAAVAQGTPEETVKSFVSLSASAQSLANRDRLQKLCVGEMRRAFERMTEEGFRLSYLNSGLKVKSLVVLDSKLEQENAKIRYRVSVENAQGTDTTNETNEREVELTKTQGSWYIETIRLKDSDKIAFTNGMMF